MFPPPKRFYQGNAAIVADVRLPGMQEDAVRLINAALAVAMKKSETENA
jgi:uncharacterized protein YigA (DUF484 family)